MPITPKAFGDRGRKRAQKLGIDPDRLPPGQSPTVKFPVLTVGPDPIVETATWSLSIHGAVDAPYVLTWDQLLAEPQVQQTVDLHCVTRWSQFDMRWRGARVRDLIERARPQASATHVLIHAHGDYTTNLPLAALLDDDVLIAHEYEGEPLRVSTAAPPGCSSRAGICGSRRNGSARSSCSTMTSRASGSATATTTKVTRGVRSATAPRRRTRCRKLRRRLRGGEPL